MTDAELAEIRARWARVIPGPWVVRPDVAAAAASLAESEAEAIVSPQCVFGHDVLVAIVPARGRPDAAAIARARDDVPRLLDEIERLRALVAEASELRERVAQLEAVVELARSTVEQVEALLPDAPSEGERAAPGPDDPRRGPLVSIVSPAEWRPVEAVGRAAPHSRLS